MKRYTICVDTYACCKYVIEAESEDQAEEKLQKIIDGDEFFEDYRRDCDFFEPTMSDIIEVEK